MNFMRTEDSPTIIDDVLAKEQDRRPTYLRPAPTPRYTKDDVRRVRCTFDLDILLHGSTPEGELKALTDTDAVMKVLLKPEFRLALLDLQGMTAGIDGVSATYAAVASSFRPVGIHGVIELKD